MSKDYEVQGQIALLIFTTLNVAVFTAACYVVLPSAALNEHAGFWLTITMAASIAGTAPLAWFASTFYPARWGKKVLAKPSPLAHEPSRPI